MSDEQIYLPFYLAEFRTRSFDTRIYLREYTEIESRLMLLAKDLGLPIAETGNVARACLRLGLQVAEEALLKGTLTVDEQPSRYSDIIRDRLRQLRERIQEDAA